MRVLVNAVGAVMGGAGRHLPSLVEALASAEPAWDLEVWVSGGAGAARTVPDNVTIRERHRVTRTGYLAWNAWGLNRRARSAGAGCMVNLTNQGPVFRGPPSVLYQRNALYFDPSWVRRLRRRDRLEAAARRGLAFREMGVADVVVTPTEAMARFLRAWPAAPGFSHVTIPHAVDGARFSYRPRPLRTLDGARLLVVSHAAAHKGMDTALGLVAGLAGAGYEPGTLTLTLDQAAASGDRRYYRMLVALAATLGIADRVRFVGRVEDAERLYHQADVVVVPSLTESFGFPLLEAMACGVPVLASSIPASLEVGRDRCSWFEAGDSEDALRALIELATLTPAEARSRLDRGRRSAEERTWAANAAALAQVVRQVASR